MSVVVSTAQELINALASGVSVQLKGGVYYPTSQVRVLESQKIESVPGELAVLDASQADLRNTGNRYQPFVYLKAGASLSRLEVRNNLPNAFGNGGFGVQTEGACKVDHLHTHNNNFSGLNFLPPGNCTAEYVVAHDNADRGWQPYGGSPDGEDADGISFWHSNNNIFRHCISYHNSDDGFDGYGSIGNLVEKCIAYANGYLIQGNGCGIKIGQSCTVRKCVSYSNRGLFSNGFFAYSAAEGQPTGNNLFEHNTAFDNLNGFACHLASETFRNNISTGGNYFQVPNNQGWNSWNLDLTLSNMGLASLDPANPAFLSLLQTSLCRGAASDATDLGALQYGELIASLTSEVTPPPPPPGGEKLSSPVHWTLWGSVSAAL